MAVVVIEIRGRYPDDSIVFEDFNVSDHEIEDIETYILAANIKEFIQQQFETDE